LAVNAFKFQFNLMKKYLLLIVILCFSLAIAAPALALPVQDGVYTGPGSRWIQIATKGDRICYNASTATRSLTASLSPHPTIPDFYGVDGVEIEGGLGALVVHQPTLDTLLVGRVHNLTARPSDLSASRDLSETMQRCLDSQGAFNETQESGR
jgi:hypothetical protein